MKRTLLCSVVALGVGYWLGSQSIPPSQASIAPARVVAAPQRQAMQAECIEAHSSGSYLPAGCRVVRVMRGDQAEFQVFGPKP